MRKFKRRQRHSLPFGLFLAVVGALLLPAAVAPRANAEVDANFSWSGVLNSDWNNSSNWRGARQAPAIPPSSTRHSSISPISPQVLLSALCT